MIGDLGVDLAADHVRRLGLVDKAPPAPGIAPTPDPDPVAEVVHVIAVVAPV